MLHFRNLVLRNVFYLFGHIYLITAGCKIHRYFEDGRGFHRTLKTQVKLVNIALTNDLPLVALIENVTSSFYVDMYQTDSLFKNDNQLIYSPAAIELEKAEPDSISYELYVYNSSYQNSGIVMAEFTLPVHIRYHKPQKDYYTYIAFSKPKLFIESNSYGKVFNIPCKNDHLSTCTFGMLECEVTGNLTLKIPTGVIDHQPFVLFVTCLVIFASVAWILLGIFGFSPNKQ